MSATGNGYPVAMLVRARELREARWSYRRIATFIESETGRRPSTNTVMKWTDPAYARRERAKSIRRHREHSANGAGAGARLGSHRHTPEFKMARVRALVEIGTSVRSIAALMSFDFGEPVSEHQIRHALRTGSYPANPPRAGRAA